jgi:hypothetical protein
MAAMAPRPNRHEKLRPRVRLLLMAAALCCFSGCFSFRVTVPLDPECVVGELAIIHSEPGKLDFEKPLSDEPFSASDTGVYALIKVLQVSKPLMLQWLWYSPDNQLVRRSPAVQINAKGKYLSYFAAWDILARSYYSEKKGNWTVLITADGSFLASREFTVN